MVRSTTARGRHAAAAFLLGLLLVGGQIEAQWHALGHFGEWMHRPHEIGLQLPDSDDACAICALLAGGANAVSASASTAAAAPHGFIAPHEPVARATFAAASYYRTRAPPLTP